MNAVVALIANALPAGLIHPDRDGKPTPIALPGFRITGMPDEQAQEFVGNAATLLAEALVHLIERDFDILPKHEAAQLQQDAADAPDGTRTIVVHELTTSGPELLHLTVGKSTDHVAITTPAIKALARRFEAQ